MKEARVTIEGVFPDEGFEALVSDQRWNGWAIPHFTEEVAREVVAAQEAWLKRCGNENGYPVDEEDRLILADVDGVMVIEHRSGPAHDDDLYEIIGPDERGLYGIGGCNWTWYEAPTEDE